MITKTDFLELLVLLDDQGREDIQWAENLAPPEDAIHFAMETIYVIVNSGMKHKVAQGIFDRCKFALIEGQPVINYFKHKGKVAAIERVWAERQVFFDGYMAATDKVEFCKTIPWVGGITCYHLAKNFGAQVAKPDVHLQRLADLEGVTAQALCERLAKETGYKISTVDTILWRACAYGFMDSRSGKIKEAA